MGGVLPGDLQNEGLSNQSGYYEQRTPTDGEFMNDERQHRPLKPDHIKNQNSRYMKNRVISAYLKKVGNSDAKSKQDA